MRITVPTCLAASVGMMICLFWRAPAAAPVGGWEDLMPGKDLKGWRRVALAPDGKAEANNPWSVDAGRKGLVCNGVGFKEMLLEDKERGDGTFHVEWRFKKVEGTPEYNSGVYVRSKADGKEWYQVQV